MWPRRGALLGLLAATSLAAQARPGAPAPSPRPAPDIPKLGRVSLVRVDGEVDSGLAAYLGRVLSDHREGEVVVLELNTLGGRLEAAIQIRDAMLASQATTLCWVRPRAISAGALITLACDVVAVAEGAMIGAATPVIVGSGDPKVDEKVASYMRQEMATTATANGRPPEVARAMVDGDVVVPGLNEKGKLVTLDSSQAIAFGVADVVASSEDELWQKFGRDPPRVERPQRTAAELVAGFLAEPAVAVVLMVLGLLGILIELVHPKSGLALLTGLGCLALFFLGHHAVNLAGWEEVLLLFAGLVLIGIEYFYPGHVVFGLIGVHLVLASLFLALVDLDRLPLGVAWGSGGIPRALASVFASVLFTFGLYVVAVRYLPESRFGKKLILAEVVATPRLEAGGGGLEALVGQLGVAITDLRPSGRVEVINRKAEARLEFGFAGVGERVRVVRVEGGRLVVEPAKPEGENG
ncbi:MAG: ATP-dependent Clp protease proteolytic subunit [Myxococcales bacterium]|nr:ATP-dependent Clp protease proteolytic subunit [Myxococcales bacterium]